MPTIRAVLAGMVLLASCRTAARPIASDLSPTAADIRSLRERSNAAIAARDARGVAAMMSADMVVIAGNGAVIDGRDASEASFAKQLADTAFLGYVRTPARIDISTVRPLAAEAGNWVGRWRRPDGIQAVRGTYLAMWRKTDAGWRLRSELFVTLTCTGSLACTAAP